MIGVALLTKGLKGQSRVGAPFSSKVYREGSRGSPKEVGSRGSPSKVYREGSRGSPVEQGL